MPETKFKELFHYSPVAIMEMDYSPLRRLGRQLETQTVTHIRQFLSEHLNLVKNTFRQIRVRVANKAAFELYSAKSKTELLTGLHRTMATTASDMLVEQFVSLLNGEETFTGEFKYKTPAGKVLDIFIKVHVPEKSCKTFSCLIVTLQDITVWKRLERELRKRAQLDGLTKLYNHSTIVQRLEEELIRAKRYGLSLACMMIDLDHFKIINDKFGHPRGDIVLKRVAAMVRNAVRRVDVVGRYGGDEFLIILPETKAENAKYAAFRIQNLFGQKMFRYQKLISFRISLSIGISGYPSKKVKDSKDLIALADKAMYVAKKSGRNRVALM